MPVNNNNDNDNAITTTPPTPTTTYGALTAGGRPALPISGTIKILDNMRRSGEAVSEVTGDRTKSTAQCPDQGYIVSGSLAVPVLDHTARIHHKASFVRSVCVSPQCGGSDIRIVSKSSVTVSALQTLGAHCGFQGSARGGCHGTLSSYPIGSYSR
jgi:hypothetical protein